VSTPAFSSVPSTALIGYTWLSEPQIHQITFTKSSREAVDDWVEVMQAIYTDIAPEERLKFLFDMTDSGTMPLVYAVNEGKRFVSGLTFHPESRVAMLHSSDSLRAFSNVVLKALRMGHLRTRFFDVDDREGAIAWLNEP